METMKTIIVCIIIGCVYGAPIDETEKPDISLGNQLGKEKTFDEAGLVVETKTQQENGALTVFMDNTHELILQKYNDDVNCYISSLADYNKTQVLYESSSNVSKYKVEPISEINPQYFSHTATDAMKRVCNGATHLLWSEIHAMSDELETRKKRSYCYWRCDPYCIRICVV